MYNIISIVRDNHRELQNPLTRVKGPQLHSGGAPIAHEEGQAKSRIPSTVFSRSVLMFKVVSEGPAALALIAS